MPDFIHIWNARHGVPDSDESVVEISNRLTDKQETDGFLPIDSLIEFVLQRYPIVSIEPAAPLVLDEESPYEQPNLLRPCDPLWRSAPIVAFEKYHPAALLLRLDDSASDFYPCVYEILRFCKTRNIVAIRANGHAASYWQPDGFFKKHASVVYNYGKDQWESLKAIVAPPGEEHPHELAANCGKGALINPIWSIVAGQLQGALAIHGFKANTRIDGAHNGQIASQFGKRVPAGIQTIKWRMARAPTGKGDETTLCIRMAVKMNIDVLPDTLWGPMKLYCLADTSAFNCELNEFLEPARPDVGDSLLMSNRDEWGPDSERASIEAPGTLVKVLFILKKHVIPWLNRCDTALNTLYALNSSEYAFATKLSATRLVLAWHVQEMSLYNELKQSFLLEAAGQRYGVDAGLSVQQLEGMKPAFVAERET